MRNNEYTPYFWIELKRFSAMLFAKCTIDTM